MADKMASKSLERDSGQKAGGDAWRYQITPYHWTGLEAITTTVRISTREFKWASLRCRLSWGHR